MMPCGAAAASSHGVRVQRRRGGCSLPGAFGREGGRRARQPAHIVAKMPAAMLPFLSQSSRTSRTLRLPRMRTAPSRWRCTARAFAAPFCDAALRPVHVTRPSQPILVTPPCPGGPSTPECLKSHFSHFISEREEPAALECSNNSHSLKIVSLRRPCQPLIQPAHLIDLIPPECFHQHPTTLLSSNSSEAMQRALVLMSSRPAGRPCCCCLSPLLLLCHGGAVQPKARPPLRSWRRQRCCSC